MGKYEDLIKRLRNVSMEFGQLDHVSVLLLEAADAIEERDRHILTLQHEMMAEAESHIAEVNRLNKQIEVLSKKEKTTRWVPVTERLPEDGSDILAVLSYCGEVRIIPANYDRDVWYDCIFNRVAEHITHWMPLPTAPEPPEEET